MYESNSESLWKTAALNLAAYLVSSVTLLPITIALFSVAVALLLYGLDVQSMRSQSNLSLGEILNFGQLLQVPKTLYFSGDLRWLWVWLFGGVIAGVVVACRLRQRYITLLVGWLTCTLVMWILFRILWLSPIVAVVLLPSFVLTQRLIPPLKRIYEWLRDTELSR